MGGKDLSEQVTFEDAEEEKEPAVRILRGEGCLKGQQSQRPEAVGVKRGKVSGLGSGLDGQCVQGGQRGRRIAGGQRGQDLRVVEGRLDFT